MLKPHRIIAIEFVLLTILGTSLQETALDVANHYRECDGEETGAIKTAPANAPHYLECGGLLGLTPKYCVYRCTAKKMGIINSKDRFDEKGVKDFADQLNKFRKKEELYRRVLKCGESQSFSERRDCETTKKSYNCMLKAYEEVCNGNSSRANEEDNEDEFLGTLVK